MVSGLHPFFEVALERRREANVPDFSDLPPQSARTLMKQMIAAAPPAQDLPELASVSDEEIPGPHGPIPIRRYRPTGKVMGSCVYFHAGGWVIGDLNAGDNNCRRFAGGAHVEVINVDYRLAPEHPCPKPLDDCFAALDWTALNCAGPLILAGESAGGNLAAACAIRARDEGGPAIAGQVIAYGVMDHDFSTGSYRAFGDRSWMLTTADMRYFWDHYCPDVVERSSPLLSPLRVSMAEGLPAMFMAVGELDVLRDECVSFAKKLEAAGIPVEMRLEPGMLHGYFGLIERIEPERDAVAAAISWIKQRLADAQFGG